MFTRFRIFIPIRLPAWHWGSVGLCLALAAGFALRTVWAEDMEYKLDEAWTYRTAQSVRDGAPLPRVGMPTSQNAPNPAGSIWVFIGLSEIFAANSPVELARVGQWMNSAALLGLALYAWFIIPAASRPAWLWAAALAAVNPLAVLMQRKIWPPSIAPLLLLGAIIGWRNRDRRWGAALWGFLVLVVGQIHLAGLFLAAGLTVWTAAWDRRGVRWRAWAIGSAAAAWPLALWLPEAFQQALDHPTGQIRLSNLATLNFFLRWISEPFGISLNYSIEQEFGSFLRSPLVNGRGTYLVGVLHVALYAAMAWFAISALRLAWQQRTNWREVLPGNPSSNWFGVNAVMLGYGGLVTLACLPTQRHYMLLTFPMMYLWLASIALADRRPLLNPAPDGARLASSRSPITRGQALLAGLCLVQFAISALFLTYVHDAHRALRGDYGMPYSVQVQNGLTPF